MRFIGKRFAPHALANSGGELVTITIRMLGFEPSPSYRPMCRFGGHVSVPAIIDASEMTDAKEPGAEVRESVGGSGGEVGGHGGSYI